MTDHSHKPTVSLRALLAADRVSAASPALTCYGLEPEAGAFEEAQQAMLSLLTSRLIKLSRPGERILLCGASLASVAASLQAEERVCQWLEETADTESGFDVLLTVNSTKPFDALLIAGQYHYLDQLTLLQAARGLLREGGSLVMLAEFLRKPRQIAPSTLPVVDSCLRLGARLGLALQRSRDLSAQAMASLDVLAAGREEAGSGAGGDELFVELRADFAEARRCLRLLEFERQTGGLGEYEEAEYGAIDSFAPREIASLFQESFEQPFDPELWRWKYELGQGHCVVARESRDGDIVAHYGGAPREILYFGRPDRAIQVCDVMVLPEKRVHYGKRSLFFKTAATFLEREIGFTVRQLLGFGFPNQKAMNIALRLGLYKKTDDFVALCLPDESVNSELSWQELDWESPTHVAEIDGLWRAMAPGFCTGIIGRRHSDYLRYRYVQHPGADNYQLGLLRNENREAVALVVLKAHEGHCLIMDIVSPRDRLTSVLQALRAGARPAAIKGQLRLWLTRSWATRLSPPGASVQEMHIEIPCNAWNPGPRAARLRGAWWLTAGDMDFM